MGRAGIPREESTEKELEGGHQGPPGHANKLLAANEFLKMRETLA